MRPSLHRQQRPRPRSEPWSEVWRRFLPRFGRPMPDWAGLRVSGRRCRRCWRKRRLSFRV